MKKFILLSFCIVLLFAVTGCSSEKETGTATNSQNSKSNTKEMNKVREYGRGAVSELQKMIMGINTSFNSYDNAFEHFGINEKQKAEFINFIKSNHKNGYAESIIFHPKSEIAYVKGDNYIYQISTETKQSENSVVTPYLMTFELILKKKPLGSFMIKDLTYKKGGSTEGVKNIASNAIDDLVKVKLDILIKNLLSIDEYDDIHSKNNLYMIVEDNSIVDTLVSEFDFDSSSKRVFINSEIELAKINTNPENFNISVSGTYSIEYNDKIDKTDRKNYGFSMHLTQRNPNVMDYTYVIDELTIEKK